MSALFLVLLLMPAAAGVCAWLGCRMEEGILLSVLGLITAGYILVLSGGVPWLGLLPWVAAAAGGVLALHRFSKNAEDWRALAQGMLLFFAFSMLYWWLCCGRSFCDWDDFSHWGRAAKWMFTTNTMYTSPDSGDAFKSYPPATAVWQVMLLKAGRFGFREDIVLFGNALLTAALSVMPFRCVGMWQRPFGVAVTAFLAAFVPLIVYPTYFARASVDGLLGVFCAALLVSAFAPGRSAATPVCEAFGCFVLALVKSSGTGLAMLAALVLLAARLGGVRHRQGKARMAALVCALAPLAATGIAKLSWTLHLAQAGVAERWQGENPLRNLWSLIIGNIPDWRGVTLTNFIATIFTQGNYGAARTLPFFAWPLAFCVLAAGAVCLARRDRFGAQLRALPLTAATLGITVAFTASLLYTYLFLFEPAEAVILASLYRYLDSCVLLLAQVAVFAVGLSACRAAPRWQAAPAAVALAWAFLFPFGYSVQAVVEAPLLAAESGADRVLSRHAAARIRALGVEDPRLWLITANDGGAAQQRIEFDLLPVTLPPQATILMADATGVLWARQITPEAWSRELAEDYDYVYIYCPEDQFVRDFLEVFEPGSQSEVVADRMFEVVPQPDGTARLRCLDAPDAGELVPVPGEGK